MSESDDPGDPNPDDAEPAPTPDEAPEEPPDGFEPV